MSSFRTPGDLRDSVIQASHFIHEKTDAKERASKLPKVMKRVSGGSAHPPFTHLSGEDPGAAGRKGVCL